MEQPFHLDQLPLKVELVLAFGDETSPKSYRCHIEELSGENGQQLGPFVEALSQQSNKRFPPVDH